MASEKDKKPKPRRSFGSIYEDKRLGKWVVRVPTGEKTPSGRTARRSYYAPTEKKAKAVLDKLTKARQRGRLIVQPAHSARPAPQVVTVSKAIGDYITGKEVQGKSPKTLEQYRANAKRFAAHPISKMRVHDVRASDVTAYMAWRRKRLWRTRRRKGSRADEAPMVECRKGTASNAAVNRDLSLLSGAFSMLVKDGLLESNPVSRVEKPKENRHSGREGLDAEDAARLIAACDDRLRPLVLAGLYTGARKGEILALNWSDVNLDAATVMIRRTKTGNATKLTMHPDLVAELRDHRARSAKAGCIPRAGDPVFQNATGKRLGNCRRSWASAVRLAGLDHLAWLTFHCLRHTFAYNYLRAGGGVRELQAIMGHSRIDTTERYLKRVASDQMNAGILAMSYSAQRPTERPPAHDRPSCGEQMEAVECA